MFHQNEGVVPFSLGDHGVKYIVKGPRIEVGLLVLLPGQGSKDYGVHYHQEVDETFFFIQGSCKAEMEGKVVRLSQGDVFTVERGERHRLYNDGQETVKALFFKYPFKPEDRVEE